MTVHDIARLAHEVNRSYCQSLGDDSQLPWDAAPEWQRASITTGVEKILSGAVTSPEQSHESWRAEKVAAGWIYGAVKDAEAKTHPCLVPYADLPPEQRLKDTIFHAIVRAVV